MGFALFSSNIPGAKYQAKTDSNPFELLRDARAICFRKMFDYAPLDLKAIEKLVPSKPKSVEDIAQALSQLKSGAVETQLRSCLKIKPVENELEAKKKGDPVDLAWSYFLFSLFESVFPQKIVEKGAAPVKNEVRFAADLDGWIVVKKVDLSKAEAKEVLAALAGMFNSSNGKLAEFSTQDFDAFSAFTEKTFEKYPERKNFTRLPQVLRDAIAAESGLSQFASGEKLSALREFFFLKAFERCGFTPFVSIKQINEIYPELKIPKPRGNYGKKKKK